MSLNVNPYGFWIFSVTYILIFVKKDKKILLNRLQADLHVEKKYLLDLYVVLYARHSEILYEDALAFHNTR